MVSSPCFCRTGSTFGLPNELQKSRFSTHFRCTAALGAPGRPLGLLPGLSVTPVESFGSMGCHFDVIWSHFGALGLPFWHIWASFWMLWEPFWPHPASFWIHVGICLTFERNTLEARPSGMRVSDWNKYLVLSLTNFSIQANNTF